MSKYAEKSNSGFEISDHQKAQSYNWFRNRRRQQFEPHMRTFLAEYETKNGVLAYDDFLPDVKKAFRNRLEIYGAKNRHEQYILDSINNQKRGVYQTKDYNQFHNEY